MCVCVCVYTARKVSPDFLGAIAATSGVTRARCLLLAASNSLTEAAARCVCVCVYVCVCLCVCLFVFAL